jgi:hypothetical protein
MPLIAQVCMVVVTIALVAMAVMAVRLMIKTNTLIETTSRSLAELPTLIEEARQISARADNLLAAFAQITGSTHAAVSQFENIATRAGALASALLDEIAHPVTRVIGVMKGIRVGASFFAERWRSQVKDSSHTNQGDDHDGKQQWLDDGGIPDGSAGRGRVGTDLRANGR